MKLNQKAQQVIEYLLLVAAVVAGVLGVSGPMGPMTKAAQRSLNLAVETISQSYMWHTGAPTPCNVACGIGTQTRTVWCQDEMGKTVDDSYCANKGRKPPETINCNAGNCGVYNWVGSGWSSCSQLCGGGIQTQATVVCKDSGGVVVADNLCPPPKPTQQTCNNQPCYIWQASNTCVGLCSEPCGIGMCDQGINCLDTLTGLPTDISKCPLPLKPPAQIFCNTALTCGYQWLTSDWNPCNKTCEDFISPPVTQKTRTVQCIRLADGAVVGDASCGGIPKPVTTGTCSIPPCNHWDIPGGWDTCTKPCGTGTQGAIVKCLDKNNVEIDPSLCDPGSKPSSSRNCNTGVCQWVTDPAYPACVAAGSCGLSNQTRNVWCIQAGFPAVKLEQQYCFNANGHLAPAESCALPTSTDCTQTQNCYQTSGCCGNGAVDNFPPAPYSEQCDDGDAAHGNGNGVCPKPCSTSCTFNGCSCPATTYNFGSCSYPVALVADGASGDFSTNTPNYAGSVHVTCNNGTPSYSGQTCNSTSCPAGNYTFGSCNYPVGLLLDGGSTDVNTNTAGYAGSVHVVCNNAVPSYSGQTCNSTACAATTYTFGSCGYPIGVLADGTSTNVNTNTAGYAGSVHVVCNNTVPTYSAQTCTSTSCPATAYTYGSCNYPIGLLADGGSADVNTNTPGYAGSVHVSCTNAVPNYSGQTCSSTSCVATSYNYGNCSYSIGLLSDGASADVNTSTPGYAGSVHVSCANAVPSYSAQTCSSTSCSATTYYYGSCAYPIGAMADGASADINTNTAGYSGAVHVSCNNAVPSYSGQTCASTSCTATSYSYGSCTYPIGGLADGASSDFSTSTPGYSGSVHVYCSSGSPSYSGQSCSSTTCSATTYYYGSCAYPIGALGNGASTDVNTNTAGYSGSVHVYCNSGSPSYSGQSCNSTSCPATTYYYGSCGYPIGLLADGASTDANTNTSGYTGSVHVYCSGGTPSYSGQTCNASCTPNCSGKNCGDDGCGGSCGTCSGGHRCGVLTPGVCGFCGDGFTEYYVSHAYPNVEFCDPTPGPYNIAYLPTSCTPPGGYGPCAYCNASCFPAIAYGANGYCGDNIRQAAYGEQCDGGANCSGCSCLYGMIPDGGNGCMAGTTHPGVCNNAVLWGCNPGTPINTVAGSCNGYATWNCQSLDGGATSGQCSKYNGACAPVCGNGSCESGENVYNCPGDCPPVCGNGSCEPGEDAYNCPADCGPPPHY